MSKRLAVLFVLLGAAAASAATLKMKEFTFRTGDDQDGVATLHYVSGLGVTKVHVTITGFEPDTSYGVMIGAIDTGEANGIHTNNGGNGELNLANPGDITGAATTITIYVDADSDGFYDTGEEVAVGTAQ